MGKYLQKLKDLTREDIILLLIILSPAILTTILMAIGEADQRATQRHLENRPNVTWREILTPEQRKKWDMTVSMRWSIDLNQARRRSQPLDMGSLKMSRLNLTRRTTTI